MILAYNVGQVFINVQDKVYQVLYDFQGLEFFVAKI
jgi:hypothetical protein